MSDNNKILNIPQKPHKTLLDKSAMDINLKSPKKNTQDDDLKTGESFQANMWQDPDLTSAEARTYVKEDSKYYGSKLMKSLLHPFLRCKYTGFLILIILFILDKLSLRHEVDIHVEDQWGMMSVIGLCGILFIILLTQVVRTLFQYKGEK